MSGVLPAGSGVTVYVNQYNTKEKVAVEVTKKTTVYEFQKEAFQAIERLPVLDGEKYVFVFYQGKLIYRVKEGVEQKIVSAVDPVKFSNHPIVEVANIRFRARDQKLPKASGF